MKKALTACALFFTLATFAQAASIFDAKQLVAPAKSKPAVVKPAPPQATTIAQGTFTTSAHITKGKALVLQTSTKTFLKLHTFSTTKGPDLFVWLATSADGKNYINLGELASPIGNQIYKIPKGTDLKKYSHVLIWCKQYGVLFGEAVLK
jgi:hypothetical protein